MNRQLNAFILTLLSALPAMAGAPALEGLSLRTLPPVAVPAAPAPYFEAGRYDWAGLPAYIFTEEEALARPLVEAIDRSRRTLDVALYNLQIDATVEALVRARDRGVKVRVLFDKAHVYPQANRQIQAVIDSGIEARAMNGRGGTGAMHCKYALFDGSLLQTGSANWSGFAESFSYENAMFVGDPDILAGYASNFDWMWAQAKPAGQPDAPAAKHTPPPSDPTPDVDFNGALLPDYAFSPRGGTEAAIVKALDAAAYSADVAMFTFTSENIMGALKRAAARGVKVRLVLFSGQKFPFFKDAKGFRMDLRFLDGRKEKGQMHNKFAVLDGRLLINGSFNWTRTAEDANTENTIFTLDPAYSAPYQAEFEKLHSLAREP